MLPVCSPPAVCCLAAYLHSPTHTVAGLLKKPSAFSPDCTAGQRPKRPQLIISREGRNPSNSFVCYRTAQRRRRQMWSRVRSDLPEGVGFTFFCCCCFFPTLPFLIYSDALGHVRPRGRKICWPEQMIRASALGRLPSDPPSLRTNVMEAEGGGERGGGGPSFTSDVFPSERPGMRCARVR